MVVATSVARETFGGVDFPAIVVLFGGGENVDEAFLVGESVVLGLLGVAFASSAASVKLRDVLAYGL